MPLQIARIDKNVEDVRECLSKAKVDAIVTVADSQGCICENFTNEIYKKIKTNFQDEKLLDNLSPCTAKAFSLDELNIKYLICVRGPFWYGGNDREEEMLRKCYDSILNLAYEKGCKSILLHMVSCGNYNIPKDLDIDVVTKAISDFLEAKEMKINLVIFATELYETSDDLIKKIFGYICENKVSEIYLKHCLGTPIDEKIKYSSFANSINENSSQIPTTVSERSKAAIYTNQLQQLAKCELLPDDIDDLMDKLPDDSLGKLIERLIKKKGIKKVYKKSNLTEYYVSQLRHDNQPNPTKERILGLAVGMECNLEETEALLYYAGYFFSPVKIWDLVVKWFVIKSGMGVIKINVELVTVQEKLVQRYGKLIGLENSHWHLLGGS